MIFDNLTEQDKNQMTDLLVKAGSKSLAVADAAQQTLAAALQVPLREGVLTGNIISNIFTRDDIKGKSTGEYPIDLYRPDNASDFRAYVIPNQGRIPERHVQGDYIKVPAYDIGSSIDFLLRYAEEANWNVVGRAMEVLEAGFTKKMNDDGWHTLLYAGFDRGILVSDANAAAGQFTKRLISLMKLGMRRNAGGNSTSLNRGKLTHLFISPEAMEDIRNWGVDEVDEVTRRDIFVAEDGTYNKIFGVTLVDLDELGDDQEYQSYYETVVAVGASNSGMASATDVEIAVGLDLSKNNSFIMPVREDMVVFNDPAMHRQRRFSVYGWASLGFGVLDNTKILISSL